jgi:hypothetical protein
MEGTSKMQVFFCSCKNDIHTVHGLRAIFECTAWAKLPHPALAPYLHPCRQSLFLTSYLHFHHPWRLRRVHRKCRSFFAPAKTTFTPSMAFEQFSSALQSWLVTHELVESLYP